ncbi:unnamed protein product [Clavelina lepadiformis]|uniref:Uncharacterized protein n=1 Tax=Clavelina lepadiformis TaxID=159417 RepID=A0ABP0GN20_CLALP
MDQQRQSYHYSTGQRNEAAFPNVPVGQSSYGIGSSQPLMPNSASTLPGAVGNFTQPTALYGQPNLPQYSQPQPLMNLNMHQTSSFGYMAPSAMQGTAGPPPQHISIPMNTAWRMPVSGSLSNIIPSGPMNKAVLPPTSMTIPHAVAPGIPAVPGQQPFQPPHSHTNLPIQNTEANVSWKNIPPKPPISSEYPQPNVTRGMSDVNQSKLHVEPTNSIPQVKTSYKPDDQNIFSEAVVAETTTSTPTPQETNPKSTANSSKNIRVPPKKWRGKVLDDDEEEEEEEDDKDEDEDYKEADDDIKKDPLFDPDEDEYVETPENSDGSGDDYIISKKSTKSRKKGRKRSSDRRLTRSQSHTMRQPRVTRSKASYQESESEDDSDEDFTLHRGQPSRHRTKSSESPARSKRAARPRRRISNQPQYLPLPSESSSEDDAIALCHGQPVVASVPKKQAVKSQASKVANDDDGTANFFIRRQHIEPMRSLFDSSSDPDTSVCIWKLNKELLQKFVFLDRGSQQQTFQATNSYLGFHEEGPELFVCIGVMSVKRDNNDHINQAIVDSDFIEYYKYTQRQESKQPAKAPAKRRGRNTKSHGETGLKPRKRKKSNIGESSATRRRGRPRKYTVDAIVATDAIAETVDNVENKITEECLGQRDVGSLKQPFQSYVKMMLTLAPRRSLEYSKLSIVDASHITCIESHIAALEKLVLTVFGDKFDSDFLADLKLRPAVNAETKSSQNLESPKNAASKLIVLKGKCYDPITLKETEVIVADKMYNVTEEIYQKSKCFHSLHHYKYHLWQRCLQKIQQSNLPKQTLNDVTLNGTSKHADHVGVTHNQELGPEQSPSKMCAQDKEAMGPGESSHESVIQALVQEILNKVLGEDRQADNFNTTEATASEKTEVEVMNNQQWVDQLFAEFSEICKLAEATIKN